MGWQVRDPRRKAHDSEGEVQAAVLIAVGSLEGAHFWRNNTGAFHDGKRLIRYGQVGSADVLGCYRGRFVAIECKARRGRLSADQRAWRSAVVAAGGVYIVAKGASADDAAFDVLIELEKI